MSECMNEVLGLKHALYGSEYRAVAFSWTRWNTGRLTTSGEFTGCQSGGIQNWWEGLSLWPFSRLVMAE